MIKYYPIIVTIAYIVVTLLTLYFGPVVYIDLDYLSVLVFMSAVMLFMVLGYGISVARQPANVQSGRQTPYFIVEKIFGISLVFGLAGFAVTLGSLVLGGGLNLDLEALGSAYAESYDGYVRNAGSTSITFLLFSLLSAPTFIANVWGLYYFKQLGTVGRTLVLLLLLGSTLILTVTSGKQKYLGDLILVSAAVFLLKVGRRGKGIRIGTLLMTALAGVVALVAFSFILSQRYAALSTDAFNINSKTSNFIRYDIDHPLFGLLGPDAAFPMATLSGYLTNGYNGLSLALNTETTWSHFMGSSYSMSVIGERIFGFPSGYLASYPYIAGVQTGWGESKWYTVFPWFASDFTFVGTIPLFGWFAYVFGRSWLESIRYENPFSILLFSQLLVGVFFLPANNQLMHSPGGLFTLLSIVILYLRFRKRYNVWLAVRL